MMDGSGGGTNRRPQARACGRGFGDRVDLDVGGTIFATSVSTLVANSTYFESLFSEIWRADFGEDGVFVDQDPGPFAILLSFMRLGYIEEKDLTRPVLMQAEFFGVEKLLAAVKCEAYLNANPDFTGSEEECCAAFDEEFGGVSAAVLAGVLPSSQRGRLERKEYCHIVVTRLWLDGRHDLVVSLDAPSCQVDESRFIGDIHHDDNRLDRLATFLDALNYVYRRGFTTLEREMPEDYIGQGMGGAKRFTFSRRAESERPKPSALTNMIVHTNHQGEQDDGPKEFACVVEFKHPIGIESVNIYADVGDLPVICRRRSRTVGDSTEYVPVYSPPTTADWDVAAAMNWLHRESYRKEEKELGAIFEKIWDKRLIEKQFGLREPPPAEKHVRLKLFSRKCQRRKDDYVRADVVMDADHNVYPTPVGER